MRFFILSFLVFNLSACSRFIERKERQAFNQLCSFAQSFSWKDYRDEDFTELRYIFEKEAFKDIQSEVVKKVWEDSFNQSLDKRYPYFNSQLRSFNAESNQCMILENFFEEKTPDN